MKIWIRSSSFAERVWTTEQLPAKPEALGRVAAHEQLMNRRGIPTAGATSQQCETHPEFCWLLRYVRFNYTKISSRSTSSNLATLCYFSPIDDLRNSITFILDWVSYMSNGYFIWNFNLKFNLWRLFFLFIRNFTINYWLIGLFGLFNYWRLLRFRLRRFFFFVNINFNILLFFQLQFMWLTPKRHFGWLTFQIHSLN